MNTYPLVSVVIPVYNEEKYLSQCIQSVLNQTYKNIECIIVNNCSTDDSLVIARKYESYDKRIKVYETKKYLNMMENHNNSLKYISKSSKYCKMVLGDDWIYKECIEKMVELAETDPDIEIVGSYRICGSRLDGYGLPVFENSDGKYIFDGSYVCRLQLLSGNVYFFGSQSTVLYNCETIRNKSKYFDETSIVADAEACYEVLKGKKFGFVYQVLSFTRMNNISYTSSMLEYAAWLVGKLRIISKYGKTYLSDEEFTEMYNKIYEDYYSYLGWKIFTEKDNNFWEFHKKELGKLNIKIKKIKLYYCAFLYIINKILNPKRTFEEVVNRKKRGLGLISNRNKVSIKNK